MHSPIFDLARDPSCILAVTPHFGGSWWSALRSGGGCPWPSPAPLDFGAGGNATSAEFSREFIRVFNETFDAVHDWKFRTRITIRPEDLETSELRLFYDSASRFFVYNPDNDCLLSIFRTVRDGNLHNTLYEVLAHGDSAILGSHDFITKRVGNTYTTSFDDYSVSRVADYEYERYKTTNINFNVGILHYAELLDLTTGKTVWRYPSEAERVRLLTYDNVRTDRGVFEAADTTRRWSVVTPLRWSSLRAATVAIRTTADAGFTSLFQMGGVSNPNNAKWVIRVPSSNYMSASVRGIKEDGTETWQAINCNPILTAGKKYVFALTFDIDSNSMALYMDGVLLKSTTMGSIVNPAPEDSSLSGFVLGSFSASDGVNAANRTDWALVFDRALKPAEIAAISQC